MDEINEKKKALAVMELPRLGLAAEECLNDLDLKKLLTEAKGEEGEGGGEAKAVITARLVVHVTDAGDVFAEVDGKIERKEVKKVVYQTNKYLHKDPNQKELGI